MNTLLSLSGTVLDMIPRTDRFSFGIGPTLSRKKVGEPDARSTRDERAHISRPEPPWSMGLLVGVVAMEHTYPAAQNTPNKFQQPRLLAYIACARKLYSPRARIGNLERRGRCHGHCGSHCKEACFKWAVVATLSTQVLTWRGSWTGCSR